MLSLLLVVVVLAQRLAVPLGPQVVSLTLPAAYLAAGLLLVQSRLRVNRLRLELFLLAASCCFAAALLVFWRDSQAAVVADASSLPSLLLLLVIYALWVLTTPDPAPRQHEAVLRAFVHLMLVLSTVGILQLASQYAGLWEYEDYLRLVVPADFLLPGYNTSARVAYLSPIYRANAFVFLEPSFFSQYCALALLIAMLLRAPTWRLGLLGGGLVSATSGTGFILLALGVGVIVVRRPDLVTPKLAGAAAAAAILVLASPVAAGLLGRAEEFGRSGSSASLRFIEPYTETIAGLDEGRWRHYIGAGPGSADRLLLSERQGAGGQAVTYTTAPKLVFEYGLVAGGVFVLFLLVALFGGGSRLSVLPAALFVMTWILSGALLQPHTATLVWLLAVVWQQEESARKVPSAVAV